VFSVIREILALSQAVRVVLHMRHPVAFGQEEEDF
jgi:hypothetical protein